MRLALLDLALVAGLLASAYLGFRGGAMRKGIMLAGLIGAIFLAARLNAATAPAFTALGMGKTGAVITAFLVIVVAVMVVLFLLVRRFTKTSGGHTMSRIVGAAFGLVQGLFAMSLILIALDLIALPDKQTRSGSVLYAPLAQVVPMTFALVRGYLPGAAEMKEKLLDTL